jgi:hypothetical protein
VSAELVRQAKQGNHVVATLRCFDDAQGTTVDAQITPVGSDATVARGPYRFASAHDAFRFLQEAMLAFQYLGCDVA